MSEYILTENIIFDSKPSAVPYNYRISYKIPQICLIIASSCKGRGGCSLTQIHMISDLISSSKNMEQLELALNLDDTYTIIRFDPAVNRAIKYALAENMIHQLKNGTFQIAQNGKILIEQINKHTTLLWYEKQCLSQINKRITKEKIEKLSSNWRYMDAQNK